MQLTRGSERSTERDGGRGSAAWLRPLLLVGVIKLLLGGPPSPGREVPPSPLRGEFDSQSFDHQRNMSAAEGMDEGQRVASRHAARETWLWWIVSAKAACAVSCFLLLAVSQLGRYHMFPTRCMQKCVPRCLTHPELCNLSISTTLAIHTRL